MCSVSSASPFLFLPQYLSHHSWQCRHWQGIHEVVLLKLSCALLCGNLMRHLEIEVEMHSLGLWSHSKFRSSLIYTITILEYIRWMSACWVLSCSCSPFMAALPGWMHPLRCNLSPLRGRGDWDHWRAFWMREEETSHSSEDATQTTILRSSARALVRGHSRTGANVDSVWVFTFGKSYLITCWLVKRPRVSSTHGKQTKFPNAFSAKEAKMPWSLIRETWHMTRAREQKREWAWEALDSSQQSLSFPATLLESMQSHNACHMGAPCWVM